jgi:membrane protein YqaA with SNARE-associated domain
MRRAPAPPGATGPARHKRAAVWALIGSSADQIADHAITLAAGIMEPDGLIASAI